MTHRYTHQALGLLRIVAGLLIIEHGTQKLFGFPGGAPTPPLMSLLGLAAILESVGGLLLILGLFSRQAAFILSGEMAVAYFMMHFPHSFFPVVNKGEMAVSLCFTFLFIAAAGPGAFALEGQRLGLNERTEQPIEATTVTGAPVVLR